MVCLIDAYFDKFLFSVISHPCASLYLSQWHLEDGKDLVVEVARYVTAEGMSDPAWDHYHAAGELTGVAPQLLVAGATQFSCDASLAAFSSMAAGRLTGLTTCLPAYAAPR